MGSGDGYRTERHPAGGPGRRGYAMIHGRFSDGQRPGIFEPAVP